jgi:hypothetical protein
MNFSDFLRRAKSSLKFWSAPAQPEPAPTEFHIDEVAERVAKLKVPEPKEPTQFHSLVKLAPIPVPREVRWESQAIYLGAWAGTAALAWGGFQVPTDWLLWYGAAAVLAQAPQQQQRARQHPDQSLSSRGWASSAPSPVAPSRAG